jgi:anti-anti-sigma factor
LIVHPERKAIVVWLAGEIDTAREDEIVNAVAALDPTPGSTIEMELSRVGFVDSRGLTAILKVKAYLDGRNCHLRIVRPQKQVLRVIELVGLGDALVDNDGLAEEE